MLIDLTRNMEHFKLPLKEDFEELLGRFQATATVRFEEFSAIWRDMNFSSIFNGKLEPNERRTFCRAVFSTASAYLFPPYTFQIRVGGLYLLYGLYHSQLSTPKEKIWMSLKDWDHVKKFQLDAMNAQHFDVVYVLWNLLAQKAFFFTAMPKMLEYRHKKKLQEVVPNVNEEFIDRPSRPNELICADMLEELANVHSHYEQLKAAVSSGSGQPNPNLSLTKNLVPKLRNAVVCYHNWQKSHAENERSIPEERSAETGISDQEQCSRRAQLLASIKSKSYGQVVEASKSRRHRQAELSSKESEEEQTQKAPNCRKRVRSLRQRTKLRLLSEGQVTGDAVEMTRLWRLSVVEDERTEEKKKMRFSWRQKRKEKEDVASKS